MKMEERSFVTETVAINYATNRGDGPPVILLHGMMDRWQNCLPLARALGERWRVFAPDMRGHGRSERAPTGVYRLADITADAVAFAEAVVGEPAVFFGHSAGAFAALEATALHPHLSCGVILGDMAFDLDHLEGITSTPESIGYHRALRELAGLPIPEIADRLETMRPDLIGSIRAAMAPALHRLDPRVLDFHAEGRVRDLLGDFNGDYLLGQVESPTLLIQADPRLGAVMTDGYVSHALGLLSSGSHIRLEGTDHNLGLDRQSAEPLVDAVLGFLESLPPGRTTSA